MSCSGELPGLKSAIWQVLESNPLISLPQARLTYHHHLPSDLIQLAMEMLINLDPLGPLGWDVRLCCGVLCSGTGKFMFPLFHWKFWLVHDQDLDTLKQIFPIPCHLKSFPNCVLREMYYMKILVNSHCPCTKEPANCMVCSSFAAFWSVSAGDW